MGYHQTLKLANSLTCESSQKTLYVDAGTVLQQPSEARWQLVRCQEGAVGAVGTPKGLPDERLPRREARLGLDR